MKRASMRRTLLITLEVRPGYYWLITGNRLADGTVLVRVQPFRAAAGETTTVDLVLRNEPRARAALGAHGGS